MRAYSLAVSYDGTIPLLDEEFDKGESTLPMNDHTSVAPILLEHDRAWDDQLDEGHEVSLTM